MDENSDSEGSHDATAFRTRERSDGSGKTDIYFNSPGDGIQHGHVVEQRDVSGNTTYFYVRDIEGNVYVDSCDA